MQVGPIRDVTPGVMLARPANRHGSPNSDMPGNVVSVRLIVLAGGYCLWFDDPAAINRVIE